MNQKLKKLKNSNLRLIVTKTAMIFQLAHYPGGVPGSRGIEREDFPAPPFPFSDQERKRRRSGSMGSNQEEEEEKQEEIDPSIEEKLR